MGRLMSPDELLARFVVPAGGFAVAGLALPWLAWESHWLWAAPVAALGVGLACAGLRRQAS